MYIGKLVFITATLTFTHLYSQVLYSNKDFDVSFLIPNNTKVMAKQFGYSTMIGIRVEAFL